MGSHHTTDGTLDELLEELEREARARARVLENRLKLPRGFTNQHYPHTRRQRAYADAVMAAMLLARDVDACAALLLGEHVPAHRLNSNDAA